MYIDPECIWNNLGQSNNAVLADLKKLSELASSSLYSSTLNILSKDIFRDIHPYSQYNDIDISVVECVINIRKHFLNVRDNIQKLSNVTGVDIEPASQTRLLDFTMNISGCILAGKSQQAIINTH